MKITQLEELSAEQKFQIMKLWNREYPAKIAFSDISDFDDFWSNVKGKKHFLLTDQTGEILGWAMVFDRNNARWFSIIIAESVQGRGYGARLLDKLKESETRLYGWVVDHDRDRKLNGNPYRSPLAFYLKNGFQVCETERLETDKISCAKIEWTA